MKTIFAVSSGAPPAAIAVLRISGPRAADAARQLAGALPPPRRAGLRTLRDPANGDVLDRALVLFFPGPNSATGEDLVELHLHGGRAVVRAVERVLAKLPEHCAAEAGEFTRRALMNGQIDLSEAEGLGDLLAAETEAQRQLAMRSAEGAVRREVEGWTHRLLAIAAQVEAVLDHSDEEDVATEAASLETLRIAARDLGEEIAALAERPPVERVRDGLRVVLGGPPNAGKSTLFNALCERDAAIVSPIAGTTRDRIEAAVSREGIAYVLVDTAGLAEAAGDAIEEIGIGRAREALAAADILLWLGDDAPPPHEAAIWVHARADQDGRGHQGDEGVAVSAVTGEGLAVLWRRIDELARQLIPPLDMVALNQRQRMLAVQAAGSLARAARHGDMLLMADELRSARMNLDAITARAGIEHVLDALFSRFCIGK